MTFQSLTPAERARRIANTLLAELPEASQLVYVARAHAIGETWLGASLLQYELTDVLRPAAAAAIVFTKPATLRAWVAYGILKRTGTGYLVADVIDAAAEMRRRAATRGKRMLA